MVKKQGGSCFKIVHEKYRAKHQDDSISTMHSAIQDILRAHPELKPSIQKFVVSDHIVYATVDRWKSIDDYMLHSDPSLTIYPRSY